MRTRIAALTVAILLPAIRAAAEPRANVRTGAWDDTTEGAIEVDAPAKEVRAALTNPHAWPELFSDVAAVAVEPRRDQRPYVRITSRILASTFVVDVRDRPDHIVRYAGVGSRGERLVTRILLMPTDGGRRTLVHISLTLDVDIVNGWSVSPRFLRQLRERKVTADLLDLSRSFGPLSE